MIINFIYLLVLLILLYVIYIAINGVKRGIKAKRKNKNNKS